ncbi:MAG: tRNA (adenosine(37)-N6)-threonylcarbamoyltransferase complex dimerization subunit type 1 TsaB [Bacteroidales bacterium]|nr:tRNA (adenosine(37)-N6)-threonylcarbamoyltransferase complex dimerization subunit type 1 TsaB [Bacteroidales bacterium]
MGLILNIETATLMCSVALAQDGEVIATRDFDGKNSHSSFITLFIDQVLEEAGKRYTDLEAIAVSEGPGSYTGLRIGVSSAKGLCYALELPLIAVGTLQALAKGAARKYLEKGYSKSDQLLFCPMIDARRMEVYSGLYDIENNPVRDVEAVIIDENSFSNYLKEYQIVFHGDGAEKCKNLLGKNKNAIFEDMKPSAKYMAEMAEVNYKQKQFVDVAYFEPFYLKEFKAGKPRVKGLK